MAIDVQGAKAAKPYVEKAGVTYTALVDEGNILGNLFGVNYVPLHYIIDEFGIYRMNEKDPQKIKEFLESEKVDKKLVASAKSAPSIYNIPRLKVFLSEHPDNVKAHLMLGDALIEQGKPENGIEEYRIAVKLNPKSAEGPFRIGRTMLKLGRKNEALEELKKAQKLDPANWIIRKQIWAIENPDKFYNGKVDYSWQKEQIEREKQAR